MLTAVTRAPGHELARCELTHLPRLPIDVAVAVAQHRAYQAALGGEGIDVIELPTDPAHPDGVFVEDTAVVLDEVAVLTCPTASRRGEWAAVAVTLTPFRPVVRLPADGSLEGGDVLRVDRTLFVGLSGRTNAAGVRALSEVIRPFGYSVVPVRVTGCLHLKTAACAVDDGTILINRGWVDAEPFAGRRLVRPHRRTVRGERPAVARCGVGERRLPRDGRPRQPTRSTGGVGRRVGVAQGGVGRHLHEPDLLSLVRRLTEGRTLRPTILARFAR